LNVSWQHQPDASHLNCSLTTSSRHWRPPPPASHSGPIGPVPGNRDRLGRPGFLAPAVDPQPSPSSPIPSEFPWRPGSPIGSPTGCQQLPLSGYAQPHQASEYLLRRHIQPRLASYGDSATSPDTQTGPRTPGEIDVIARVHEAFRSLRATSRRQDLRRRPDPR
jgi:hypothetical protein